MTNEQEKKGKDGNAVVDEIEGEENASGATTPTHQHQETTKSTRQAFIRQASLPALDARKPALAHRWLHAAEGAKSWNAFGALDSRDLEKAWRAWSASQSDTADEKEDAATADAQDQQRGRTSENAARKSEYALPPPNPDEDLAVWRVPVMIDHLFEVDLRSSRMSCVFWKAKPSEVMRGTWYFDAVKLSPCTDAVAQELETLYDSIQPWLPSYADELKSSVSIGADGEDKLKAPMKSLKGSYVIFLGPSLARIYSDDVSSRLAKSLWTAWSGAHGGGTLVARGYDVAQKLLRTREASTSSTPQQKTRESLFKKNEEARSGQSSSLNEVGHKSPEEKEDSSASLAVSNSSDAKQEGAAKPPPSSSEVESRSSEDATLATSLETGTAADGIKSWVSSKMNSWGLPSSASLPAQQLSKKTQEDVKAAFTGAQTRAQDALNEREKRRIEKDIARDKAMIYDSDDARAGDVDKRQEGLDPETEEEELRLEQERESQPLDLILVWHGIGQKIAEEWKSLDFTLAVTNLRNLMQKRESRPAPTDVGGGGMAELSKGRRCQLLPVLWRATLEDFEPTSQDNAAHPEEHLDNEFTIDDIFSDTMPIIKQLISGVLFDIPLYLSHHREEIMRRVIRENNRILRLFVQRNPDFFKNGGRVNLIAHSLGAALATDILSKQPTQARQHLQDPGSELCFDVHNLYLAGSPVALFMWINKAQLIARRGRELTQNSEADEALARAGRWGCLAVDRIFNIFSASDPIGTRLNPTVDAKIAQTIKSVALTRAVKSILRTLPETLAAPAIPSSSKLFGAWTSLARKEEKANNSRPTSSSGKQEDIPDDAEGQFGQGEKSKKRFERTSAFAQKWKGSKAGTNSKKRSSDVAQEPTEENIDVPKEKEVQEQWDVLRGSSRDPAPPALGKPGKTEECASSENRGERRINALCEFGCVDFVIPSSTSLLSNQYMEFLWSHAGYWTEPSFADFILATIHSSPERLREAREKLRSEP